MLIKAPRGTKDIIPSKYINGIILRKLLETYVMFRL